MTDPQPVEDLGGPAQGGPGLPEPPASRALVRATANLNRAGERIRRDHIYMVDLTLAETQKDLRAGWIIPLPADQQPARGTS